MKSFGCFFLVLLAIGVLIGFYLNQSATDKLNGLKQDVVVACSKAPPVFLRRYEHLDDVLCAYEYSLGLHWTNGYYEFTGNPRQFNQSWGLTTGETSLTQELHAEEPEQIRRALESLRGTINIVTPSPEPGHGDAVMLTVPSADNRAVEQVREISVIEQDLLTTVSAAIRTDAIKDPVTLERLKEDIAATDTEAGAIFQEINTAVARYNSGVYGSYLGKKQGFEPISIDLQMAKSTLINYTGATQLPN